MFLRYISLPRCYYHITLVIIVHDWEHNVDMDAKVHRRAHCQFSSESFCLSRRLGNGDDVS